MRFHAKAGGAPYHVKAGCIFEVICVFNVQDITGVNACQERAISRAYPTRRQGRYKEESLR